jgi:hypothetical protein
MTRAARTSRVGGTAALLAVGALTLHQLRYLLAYGERAGAELERQGHSYLEVGAPLLVAVAAAVLVASVVVPALVRLTPALDAEACTTERAAGYAAGLLAVYFAQELTEGLLAAQHPAGLAGALGAGGWIVLPLAMALGAVAAIARGWLHHAEQRLTDVLERRSLPRAPRRAPAPVLAPVRRPLSLLSLRFGFACRPPPLAQRA